MDAKGIVFSGGPLLGQQLMVQDFITEYKFKRLKSNLPTDDGWPDTEDCFYYKSKYKVGELELFIWQDDYKPPMP